MGARTAGAGKPHAPRAFLGLFQGKNFGKLIVRVGQESQ